MRKKLTASDAKGTAPIAGFFTVNSQKQALTEDKKQEIRNIVEKEFGLEFAVIKYVGTNLEGVKQFETKTFDVLGSSDAPIILRNHTTFKALNIVLVKLFKGDAALSISNEHTDEYRALVNTKLARVSKVYKCEDQAFNMYQDIQVKAEIIEVIDSMLKKAADNLEIEHARLPREFYWDKGAFKAVQFKDVPVRSVLARVNASGSGSNTPPLVLNRSLNSSAASIGENVSPEGGSQEGGLESERKRPRVDAFALMMSASAPKKVDRRDRGAGGRS